MTQPDSTSSIEILLKNGKVFKLLAEKPVEHDTLRCLSEEKSAADSEERFQLLEGAGYEYELPADFSIQEISDIVRPLQAIQNRGRITPNIYVGRLSLSILYNGEAFDTVALEVRSVKADYRTEYRKMLEDITTECTELLMIHSSPVTQRFVTDHAVTAQTLYQRFAFVKSVVDSEEFRNAVHRIMAMPVTAWSHRIVDKDVRRAGRITPSQIRQIASRSDRIMLPETHPLCDRIKSVPAHLKAVSKADTVDTQENRFVKHALREFLQFCTAVCSQIEKTAYENKPPIWREAKNLEERIGGYLSHAVFREVSNPSTIPFNSPILQRKEGYREVLRVWLMFDLAAKLCWNALEDDQYHAGKREVATLYEYWLFFKLLRIIQQTFSVEPKETKELIQETADGLGLQLRQGRHIAVEGVYKHQSRKLRIQFHYNRTFGKAKYPAGGSWTQQMRPDYTLSMWPDEFTEVEAEKQEIIVHIHFDAKYKVEGLQYLLSDEKIPEEPENFNSLSDEAKQEWFKTVNCEKQEQKEGTYKRADLLKMHAYKDAIRRTAGAYVLYPGSTVYKRHGFHEIIPGLGAFPVSPSNSDEGIDALKKFIVEVAEHFTNRASLREELSYHTYNVNKDGQNGSAMHQPLPEKRNGFRSEPPGTSYVLVGFYQEKQLDWIRKNSLYNIRADQALYSNAEMGARYLLLHGAESLETGDLWQIEGTPQSMTKADLLKRKYPDPTCEHYLVYAIKKNDSNEFAGVTWDIRKLQGYTGGHASGRPFAVTLTDLMSAKIQSFSS